MATQKNLSATKVKKVPVAKKNPPAGGVKKVAPKIASVKKTTSKKKPLLIVTGKSCFWVNNGPSLRSLKDLRDALRTMSEEQYIHHAGMGRNDFSLWVSAILADKKCAADLLKAEKTKDALSAVEKHLKGYIA